MIKTKEIWWKDGDAKYALLRGSVGDELVATITGDALHGYSAYLFGRPVVKFSRLPMDEIKGLCQVRLNEYVLSLIDTTND